MKMILNTKLVTMIVLILFATSGWGQTEKVDYKIVADRFEKDYNDGNYQLLFEQFSDEMKKVLPIEKTNSFFSGLKQQAGQIIDCQFIRYEQTAAVYKTKFQRGLFSIHISVDSDSKINGFYVRPFAEVELSKPDRNKTKLRLPFQDEWTVVWGGDTKEQNYHVENIAQKNAFDFVVTDNERKSYKTKGSNNDDYYAFGKEIFALCDGEVVLVVDGVKDNIPGKLNPVYVPGNTVIIKTENDEYLFFAHFKQHSIKVKQGQKVKQGHLLGLCGNSGNSSEPHLHFHIQNAEDMNIATGIKCYFETIQVNGQTKQDYSPVKGDKIKP